MNLTKRQLLLGAGATIVSSALPFRAYAQTSSATVLGVSKNGYVTFPATAGGVSLSRMQRAAFGRVATSVAAHATTRAAANATMSAVVRTAMTGSMRFGLYGLAAAAAIGGVYYLATGENPVDGLLNLGLQWDGGAAGGVTMSIPCDCTTVPYVSGGKYPDSVPMGFYRTAANCGTTVGYRVAVKSSNPTTSSAENKPGSDWTWGYTETLGTNSYRHFYTKTMSTSNCSTGGVNLPGNTDLEKTLSTTDKAKLLAQNSLDALGISLWTGIGKGSSWTGGGFTGGGGGSFGGAGATGTWTDPAPAVQKAVAAGKGGVVISPLPTAVRGTGDDVPAPTVGDMYEPWTPTADPGMFEFPSTIPFPDDSTPPSTGGGTGGGTTPTPSPTPTPTPSTGGTSSGEWDWTKYLPSMPTLGLPSPQAIAEGVLPTLAAPAIAAPTIAASCVDPSISIPFPSGVTLSGGVTWGTFGGSPPICKMIEPAGTFFKPLLTGFAYVVAAIRVARKL